MNLILTSGLRSLNPESWSLNPEFSKFESWIPKFESWSLNPESSNTSSKLLSEVWSLKFESSNLRPKLSQSPKFESSNRVLNFCPKFEVWSLNPQICVLNSLKVEVWILKMRPKPLWILNPESSKRVLNFLEVWILNPELHSALVITSHWKGQNSGMFKSH